MTAPAFPHDCGACRFVGFLEGHDIYVCPQHGMPTIVARFGADGAAYASGPRLELSGVVLSLTSDQARLAALQDARNGVSLLEEYAAETTG